MGDRPLEFTRAKLLLGEGIDEARFFQALLKTLDITDIQVMQYGGKRRLREFLKTLPAVPGFTKLNSIGLTRDADDDFAGATQSVRDALQAAGLLGPNGPTAPQAPPRINVLVLPDNSRPGMLEDTCYQSVAADAATPCVEDYFRCIAEKIPNGPRNMSKARVHTWLASREEPDKRLGEVAQAGYWQFEHPSFTALVGFIRGL